MNAEIVSQLFFDERHVVPAAQRPRATLDDALAAVSLVDVLQAACERALTPCIDEREHVVTVTGLECRRLGLVPGGGELRITGWVERIGEAQVWFTVHAQDAHEQVCDATIVLAIVPRQQLADVLVRKQATLARLASVAPV